MAYFHPAWLEHQRRRWMPPSAQRWIRPHTHGWMRPSSKLFFTLQPDERKGSPEPSVELDLAAEREELLRLKNELAALKAEIKFRRLLRTIKAYNPNQPRVPVGSREGGQWTSGGEGAVGPRFADSQGRTNSSSPVISDASPDPIRVWTQYAQIGSNNNVQDPAIERTKKILLDTLVRVNASVASRRDPLSASQYGTRVHKEFADAVRDKNLKGIGRNGVEQSFDRNGLARYGQDGSIRTDVILRNDEGKIIAVYDVKTGNATMGPTRAEEIRAYTRVGTDVPIIILHAVRGASQI